MERDSGKISRREVFKTGIAVIAMSNGPALRSLPQLESGPGRITLHHNGETVFELRSSWFVGHASLWQEDPQDGRLSFGIENARYAGVDIPADSTFELWESASGIQAIVHHHGLGVLFRGRAEDWLGEQGLIGYLGSATTFLEARSGCAAVSPGSVTLRGDCSLEFGGIAGLEVPTRGIRIESRHALLRPAGDNQPETIFEVNRGEDAWELKAPRGSWNYSSEDFLGKASIRFYEADGSYQHELAFSSSADFDVIPHQPLTGTDGRLLRLSMRDAAYAVNISNGTGEMTAQLAGSHGLHLGPLQLLLDVPQEGPSLRAGDNGCCIIAQGGLAGEIDTALVLPTDKTKPWNVALLSDKGTAGSYAQATLDMVGKTPELRGQLHLRVLRPADGLDVSFLLTNVALVPFPLLAAWVAIRHHGPGEFSLLIADLGSQAMIQPPISCSSAQGGDDCATSCMPPHIGGTRLSAPTRVSMRFLAAGDKPLPLNLATLLEWARYPLEIDPRAKSTPDVSPAPTTPVPQFTTEIVAPAGLSVSPDENHAFFASSGVRRDGDVNQLWTARLSRRIDPAKGSSAQKAATHFPVTIERRPSLRPIFAHSLMDQGEFVIHADELQQIVIDLARGTAPSKHCVVSSNGGWLDFGATWWPPDAKDLSSFHDKIAGGVELESELTFEARLAPSGHRVTIVRSGRLQWCRTDDKSVMVARFIERYKIVYDQPTLVSYAFLRKSNATRTQVQLPFNAIELLGKETPYLHAPAAETFTDSCSLGAPPDYQYWAFYVPAAGGYIPYEFPVLITDRANIQHRTTMRMLVGCYNRASDSTYNSGIVRAYNAASTANIDTSVNFHGERVAYAAPTQMGNTSYPTGKMRLEAVSYASGAADNTSIPWYPRMVDTIVQLEQVSAFTASGAPVQRTCTYAQPYKLEPFDYMPTPPVQNRGEVILAVDTPAPFIFNGALGGGLAKPTSAVVGLARKAGTLFSANGDIQTALNNIGQVGMQVSDIFGGFGAAASLLGAVDLSEILDEVADGIAQASKLPQLAVQQIQDVEAGVLSDLQTTLAPLLQFRQQATNFFNQYSASVNTAYNNVRSAIDTAISLLRVLATEQTPDDIKALETQTVDPTLQQPAMGVAQKLGLSAVQRIERATVMPSLANNLLPTLYQLRDYALHNIVDQTSAAAQQFASALDGALETGQAYLKTTLDDAVTSAGQSVLQLNQSLVLQFHTQIENLMTAIEGSNVQAAVDAFQSVAEIAAAIPSLVTAARAVKSSIASDLQNMASSQNIALLRQRTSAVTRIFAGLQVPVPPMNPGVLQAITSALQTGGAVEAACNRVFANVDQQITAVNQLIGDVLSMGTMLYEENQFQLSFVPQLQQIQDAIAAVTTLLNIPKQIKVNYTYNTTLHDAGPFVASWHGIQSTLQLNSSVLLDLGGAPPQYNVSAVVSNFQLNLIPSFEFVSIGFPSATFTSTNGNAPVVNVPLDPKNISLVGPLDFVAGLTSALGLPSGLTAQVTGGCVTIGYNAVFPSFTAFAFNIVGLSVYTAVQLHFDGSPLQAIFGFANPNQHFTVTYFFLGGGGFLDLEFVPGSSTVGMSVSGAFELGAMAALDLGVASGDVHAFLGIYFGLSPNDLVLSGYFRAGGNLNVLGLITVSIEFLMSLTYENRGGEAWLSGDCEVDVDVKILFVIDETVSLHLHHDFSGHSLV